MSIALIVTQGQRVFDADSGLPIFTFDATLEEGHEMSADATEHPVAQGANPDDHVRVKKDTLTLRGVITNTPITGLAIPDARRVADTFALMEQILKGRVVCKIVTPLKVYDSLICVRISATRSRPELSLEPTMEFKELRKVQLQSVAIPASIVRADQAARAQSEIDKAQQAKKDADNQSKLTWNENKTATKNALENVAKIITGEAFAL